MSVGWCARICGSDVTIEFFECLSSTIARAGSGAARHVGPLCCRFGSLPQNSVASRLAPIRKLQIESGKSHRLTWIPEVKNQPPNPSLQPTATSHRLRHMISGYSITPSRWLLSHPSCRRSISELTDVFFLVAVAELFR